ncbi:hypothetical protein KEJ21_03895 [Candidatus Bathyarchaeota archaeon]|nr:hypothetical protein [Candidatus Bathyarchaeota archaeon]
MWKENIFLVFTVKSVRYSDMVPAGVLVKSLIVLVTVIIVFTSFFIFLLGETSAEDFQGSLFVWGFWVFIP